MADIRSDVRKLILNLKNPDKWDYTGYVTLDVVDGKRWAIVIGWMDGFEDEGTTDYKRDDCRLCGKVAYQSEHSVMQEYDYDWLMPYDENTGEVWDTNTSIDSDGNIDSCIDWWLNEWETIKDIYVYPDEDIESATDVCSNKRFDTVDEITDSFVKKGWSNDTRFHEATSDEVRDKFGGLNSDKRFFVMDTTGNWYDDRGKIASYNIKPIKQSETIECVGHNEPGRYFDLVDYFDVWGNEEDGWEVNDVSIVERDIWISDDTTEEELFNFLKDSVGYFNKDVKFSDVEIIWDSPEFIEFFDASNGYPLGRLQESYKK